MINQDGKIYSEENISGLLEFRAAAKKMRKSGGRLKGPAKRTEQQNTDFEIKLELLLKKLKLRIRSSNSFSDGT